MHNPRRSEDTGVRVFYILVSMMKTTECRGEESSLAPHRTPSPAPTNTLAWSPPGRRAAHSVMSVSYVHGATVLVESRQQARA